MKTEEELKVLKKEVEAVKGKLAELTDDELEQVSGGVKLGLSNSKKPGIDSLRPLDRRDGEISSGVAMN